ncbi:hypothetical protein TSAR_013195 [Trichomalopsis sarcophagae]|uniref:Uncharacterized protein n=1 Tax=Trichomalopsis sarcophagae TaxID=543379 RepID=A0A232FCU3_9HYME|nr:hypothetical protein TSAR_013195 [Trichomalopsis sarcophagae]
MTSLAQRCIINLTINNKDKISFTLNVYKTQVYKEYQLSSLKAADLASLVETEEIVRHGNMKFILFALFIVFAAMQMEYVQALECNEFSQARCVIECRGDRDAVCTRGLFSTTPTCRCPSG